VLDGVFRSMIRMGCDIRLKRINRKTDIGGMYESGEGGRDRSVPAQGTVEEGDTQGQGGTIWGDSVAPPGTRGRGRYFLCLPLFSFRETAVASFIMRRAPSGKPAGSMLIF